MAGSYLPLAALLLATAVTVVLVTTSTVPLVAAAATDKYSGRMVIIRAPGATVVSAGSAPNEWQRRRRHLVEDEVAPEFGGGQLLGGVGSDDSLNKNGLNPNKQVCVKTPCTPPGGSYIRPCTFKDHCPHTPNAVHV